MSGLVVLETHPIQYHAPVYRALQQRHGIPVTAIYGSDFSLVGYRDREFGASFAWDSDLLSGYTSVFLDRVAEGGARSPEQVSTRGLGAALRRAAPAAVLVVGYSPRFHQLAFYAAWRSGCPILFRGETTDHASQRSPLKALARDRALRWLYGRSAQLLYVGERSRQHYLRLGCPEARLVFAPYCVDPAPFECGEDGRARLRSSMRRELGVAESQIALLFSGKLSPRKRPDLVLEAVRELPVTLRQRVVVVYVGSGDLRDTLDEHAGRAPPVSVRFAGFQNQSQLSAYYHAADLLVLPSQRSETWGLVVNEALHHGLPCVVSDVVGCAPDLVIPGATGAVFASGVATSLAVAIARSLHLIEQADVRERCRRQVRGYSLERAADGLARAYARAVGSAA